jgi:hypothetical protein
MSCGLDPNQKTESEGCATCASGPRVNLATMLKLIGVMVVVLLILDHLQG